MDIIVGVSLRRFLIVLNLDSLMLGNELHIANNATQTNNVKNFIIKIFSKI